MPFYVDQTEEDLKKQQQEQGQQNISGSYTVINNPNAQNAVSKPGAPKQSGSWANLQKYLDANKENSAKMASSNADDVNKAGDKATKDIDALKTNTPGPVKAHTADDYNNSYYNNPLGL